MSFQDLGLLDAVVHGVQSLGFSEPTPVQARCIPLILSGRDVIGSAQTGTGKTAAFGLPILTRLKKGVLPAAWSSNQLGSWPFRWKLPFNIMPALQR